MPGSFNDLVFQESSSLIRYYKWKKQYIPQKTYFFKYSSQIGSIEHWHISVILAADTSASFI